MGPFALEECHRVYFDPNLKILSFYGIRKLLLCYGIEDLSAGACKFQDGSNSEGCYVQVGTTKLMFTASSRVSRDHGDFLQIRLLSTFGGNEYRYHIANKTGICYVFGVNQDGVKEAVYINGPDLTSYSIKDTPPEDPELMKLLNLFLMFGVKIYYRGKEMVYDPGIDIYSEYDPYPTPSANRKDVIHPH